MGLGAGQVIVVGYIWNPYYVGVMVAHVVEKGERGTVLESHSHTKAGSHIPK